MADESPPDVTARSQDLFAHPRISGGDGSSLDRLVKIDSTGMEMGLMLMQLWLEQALGLKGRDWLPGTERWVDSANHAPRTVRAVGVELRDGSEREYFFELGGATVFGREFRSGASFVLPPVPEPAPVLQPPPVPEPPPVLQPPPVPRAVPLGLVPVTGPLPLSATVPASEPAEREPAEREPAEREGAEPSVAVTRELSELLNVKEPWQTGGAGSSGRQSGVDWAWWLTLAAAAVAGALAVAWW